MAPISSTIEDDPDNITEGENPIESNEENDQQIEILKIPPNKKTTNMSFIVTNARSLAPKINSLINCFTELDLFFSIVTESWLRDGKELREAVDDLNAGCNLDIITPNRKARKDNRMAGVE